MRIRWRLWREHWRLLLVVKLCRLCMVCRARPVAECVAIAIGGPAVSRTGLKRWLDSLQ